MKVELFRNICNCCADSEASTLHYPVLMGGELFACNDVVAVRYTETGWRQMRGPDVPWLLTNEEVKGLKPRDELCFDGDGFYATDVRGNPLGLREMGRPAHEFFPDFPRLWEGLLPKNVAAGRIDPKQLRKVLGVFQLARIYPVIESTGSGLRMWGTHSFAGYEPYVEAIVVGMR